MTAGDPPTRDTDGVESPLRGSMGRRPRTDGATDEPDDDPEPAAVGEVVPEPEPADAGSPPPPTMSRRESEPPRGDDGVADPTHEPQPDAPDPPVPRPTRTRRRRPVAPEPDAPSEPPESGPELTRRRRPPRLERLGTPKAVEDEHLRISMGRRRDVADDPEISDFDEERADIPAGAHAIPHASGPVALTVDVVLALVIPVVLAVVLTSDVRADRPGPAFAAVSIGAVLLGLFVVQVVVSVLTGSLTGALLGPPIAGPGTIGRRHVVLAMRAAHHYDYTFSGPELDDVERFRAIEDRIRERRLAERDTAVMALQSISHRGLSIEETMAERSVEFASALLRFLTLAHVVSRVVVAAFYGLMVLVLLAARDVVSRWLIGYISIALAAFAGAFVVVLISRRMSVVRLDLDVDDDEVTAAERALLDDLSSRYLYPVVAVDPQFYAAIQAYTMLINVPLLVGLLAFATIVFHIPALTLGLWPDGPTAELDEVHDALVLLFLLTAIFIACYWLVLFVIQGLRTFMRPVVIALLTVGFTVAVAFAVDRSADGSAIVSVAISVVPGAVATGIADRFWPARRSPRPGTVR